MPALVRATGEEPQKLTTRQTVKRTALIPMDCMIDSGCVPEFEPSVVDLMFSNVKHAYLKILLTLLLCFCACLFLKVEISAKHFLILCCVYVPVCFVAVVANTFG